MKNILSILLLAMMVCCWSCSGGGEDVPTPTPTPKPETNKIEISTSAPVVEQKGGTASVSFTSNAAWTASVGASTSWLKVAPTSGAAGSHTLTITTEENNTYDERNATLTIKAGNASQNVTITQKQKDGLTVTSNKVEVGADGGDFSIEAKANVSVSYEIEESAKDWISASESRGLTTKTLHFTAKANDKVERRQGNIIVKGGDGLTETVTVYQEGEKPTLVITSDDIIVGSDGETIKIELKSNVEYTMVLPEVDWINKEESRAISAYTHYLTIVPNEAYEQRSAVVYFQNGAEGLKDSINITQLQKDAIIVAKNEYEVAPEGGKLKFTISTNVDFEVSTSVDWIKQNTTSRNLVEKELSFEIEENEDKNSREGEIYITFGNLKQTIKVIQKGAVDYEAIERAALIEFYKAAGGENWVNKTNWCSDKPLNEWYGIDTDAVDGRVLSVNFGYNGISGDATLCINALQPLSRLTSLRLELNGLTGEIPETIGEFKYLECLRLDFNNLSGEIPESMSKLVNLKELLLPINNLSGDISCFDSFIHNLERLDLRDNKFTGKIPEFGDNMVLFAVSNNLLTGSIPESHVKALDGNRKNPGGGYNTKYGCWYEIYGNNLTGKVPEKMLNHENWHVHWYNVVRQNEGYGFDEVDLPAPKNTVKCYDGTFLNLDEVYAKNKYTLVFRWNPFSRSIRDCPDPNPDEESINKLFQKYKEQGLGMICSTSAKYSDEEVKTLTSMIPNVKVFWEIQSNYTDDTYENNPYYTYDGGWHYLFKAISSPHFMVVNNDGNIIYSGSEEGCINCYGGVFPQYHKDNNDIFDFVANLFGDDKYIEEKPEIYTSTDYSRDGEIVTLQTASVGKGINLTFMGEAFVDKDMEPNGLYEQKMNEAMEKLFSVEPYSSMRNRFNVYAVKVISPNAEFSEYAEHRINESDSICFEYAQKIPNADKNPPMVSVVYNNWADRSYTTMYSDGSFVGYMMDGISNVLIHESGGHGFANLLDEYVEPGLENSTLSQDEATLLDNLWSTYSWGANVDWRKDKETVKWSHLLKDSRYANEGLGLYEGAYLYGYGAYRPTENSMMRHNNAPFNAPSREQIYKRIMQLSEGEDWKYNYEEFVKFDENNRNSESRSAIKPLTEAERKEYIKNHRPPTFIKGTWRDAMKNGKSRIVVPLR